MIWRKISAAGCALALSALALAGGTFGGPSASAATSPCTVSYSLTNSWPGGFQAGITITNNGAALTNWTLAFTFPDDQAVSNGWNATFTQNGQDVKNLLPDRIGVLEVTIGGGLAERQLIRARRLRRNGERPDQQDTQEPSHAMPM